MTGVQHPLLQPPAERGGGRCELVVVPSPHLFHPSWRRAAITGRLSWEQTVLTLLSSVGKSLINTQRKSMAVPSVPELLVLSRNRGASGVAGQKKGFIGYKSQEKAVILPPDISTIRRIG